MWSVIAPLFFLGRTETAAMLLGGCESSGVSRSRPSACPPTSRTTRRQSRRIDTWALTSRSTTSSPSPPVDNPYHYSRDGNHERTHVAHPHPFR
jgi:hypothetical protein